MHLLHLKHKERGGYEEGDSGEQKKEVAIDSR